MEKRLLRIEDIFTLRLRSRHGTDMGGGVLFVHVISLALLRDA